MRLNKSRTVDFNGLSSIPTPDATDTWQPMAHHRVMKTVIEHADARNLAIDEIHYSLVDVKSDGVIQPYPDMFATMYMESDNGVYRNMLGIRNSHNKRFGASACSGSSVMVCSNGCFSGDHIISSKHTKNVHDSFNNRVSDMFDGVINTWIKNEHRYNGYRATNLSDSDFAQLLGDAIIHKAINPSKARKVFEEYVEPRHDAFADRNAWSAFNAFTEIHKESPVQIADSAKRGIALHNVFDRFCSNAIEHETTSYVPEIEYNQEQGQLQLVDVIDSNSKQQITLFNN